jgi:hypothetical protein
LSAISTLLGYLISQSTKVNAVIPDKLKTGLSGVAITLITTRLVLIGVLISLTFLGSHRKEAELALDQYVFTQLGITAPETVTPPLTPATAKPSPTGDAADW